MELKDFINSFEGIAYQVANASSDTEIQEAGTHLAELLETNLQHLEASEDLKGRVIEVIQSLEKQSPALQELVAKVALSLNNEPSASSSETAGMTAARIVNEHNNSGTLFSEEFFAVVADFPPAARVELAKLCAQEDGIETAKHIEKFGVKEPIAKQELFLACVKNAPQATQYWREFALNARERRPSFFRFK